MTEKQLHKLKRQDLLQLLLAQGREAAQLQEQLDAQTEELKTLQDTKSRFIERLDEKDAQVEKLKPRLDEKDAQIEKLTGRLNEKDAQIEKLISRLNEKDAKIGRLTREIEQYRSGEILGFENNPSIDEISHKLSAIFKAAQKAVDEYLDTARSASEEPQEETAPGKQPQEDTARSIPGQPLQPESGPSEKNHTEEHE